MRNRALALIATAVMFGLCGSAHAMERVGTLGLNYTVGPSFLAGSSDAKDAGQTVGPGVGAALDLGLAPFLSFQFGYDYFSHFVIDGQDLTFSGVAHLMPEQTTSPFLGFGIGFGKRYPGDNMNKFALKMQAGIEHFLNDNVSFSGVFTYNYINGPSDNGRDVGSLHLIEPGLRVTYYFGRVFGSK